MFTYLLTAFIAVIGYIYFKITRKYEYWSKRGVTAPQPKWFVGNVGPVFSKKESINTLATKLYFEYPKESYLGIYQAFTPSLLIRDPELIRRVLIKDFSSFVNRGFKIFDDPEGSSLFMEEGDRWRILRQRFSPVFTSGKMKQMMHLVNDCLNPYIDYVSKLDKSVPHEMRDLKMKFTMKTIASVAFGVEIDPFSNKRCVFTEMAKKLNDVSVFRVQVARLMNSVYPNLSTMLNYHVASPDLDEFFLKLVKEIVQEREGKPKVRRDFMDLMIEMKEEGTVKKKYDDGVAELEITETMMVAQAIVFYAGGFETSSGTMSFILYELALHPEIQEKCYEEIKSVMNKYEGVLQFEAVPELQYLEMVFDETLRKYPVVGVVFRQAVTDYKVPDSNLVIEKNTKIMIPVPAIQMDPKYFPDPEKFDPSRFEKGKKDKIVDGTYLPFGDGPRNCIGLRFGKIQSLLGVAYFLNKYRVEPCEKTPKKIRFDTNKMTLVSADGIWLNIKDRV